MLPMLSHLPLEQVASWGPAAFVILVSALGLTVAGSPPASRGSRRFWMVAIFVCGSLAVAGTVWQAQERLQRKSAATALLRQGEESALALAAPAGPPQDHSAARQPPQARMIAPDTAAKLAAYLKKSGSHTVIVSVIPGDLEAYEYANQLVDLLHAAAWQVGGPEITKVFGDLRAVGVNLFANPTQASDATKILADAFDKFNIPYEPRVTPSGVVPDNDAIELFVGALPGTRIASPPIREPALAPSISMNPAAAGEGSGSTEDKAGQP